jgi:hypothetical protein
MTALQPLAERHVAAEKTHRTAQSRSGDDSDEERCSYEVERDKRVAKMRELLKPLVLASNNL